MNQPYLSLSDIPRGSRLLIDTAPIVYALEGHPSAIPFMPIFTGVQEGAYVAVITPITMAEVLVGPLRHGKKQLADRYRRALSIKPGWEWCDFDDTLCAHAAELRATTKLKLPDALQAAAVTYSGSFALVTHDRDFSALQELRIYRG